MINQAIFVGNQMRHTLLNPNQLRFNGLQVHECPTQFDPASPHAIYLPSEEITIPLDMRGVISAFPTRLPDDDDIEYLPKLVLTRDVWDPKSENFQVNEENARVSAIHTTATLGPDRSPDEDDSEARYVHAVSRSEVPKDMYDHGEEADNLYDRLVSQVNVDYNDHEPEDHGCGSVDVCDGEYDVHSVITTNRRSKITPAELAHKWGIGLETAKRTLKATTQSGIRNIYAPSDRKVRLKAPWLKFPALNIKLYGDAMFSKVPGIKGERGGTVFTDGKGFDHFYPWKTKKEYQNSLMALIHDVGVPKTLVTDGGSEMQQKDGKIIADEYRVKLKVTVPYSPWQNLAEAAIREMKRFVRTMIRRRKAPKRLWAYCAKWGVSLRRLTALSIPELDERTPSERVTGSTPDITAYCLFEWYQAVYYHMPINEFPYEKRCIGRLIGVADNCEDKLAYVILTKNGDLMVRKSVWGIPPEEMSAMSTQADILEMDRNIEARFGDSTLDTKKVPKSDLDDLEELEEPPVDLFEEDPDPIEFADPLDMPEADGHTPEAMDEHLTATLLLPHGEGMQRARVLRRYRNDEGIPVGKRHPNPLLDTRLYEVEYPDGSTDVVNTNLIAENLYSQIDKEGETYTVMVEILDHRRDDTAVPVKEGFIKSKNGQARAIITTAGWELLISYKDGTTAWVPLKDLKISNPVEVAEYAVGNNLDKEPAFRWWVRGVLKKREMIIKKVKTRYWKRTHKFGIELPHSVKEALAIDARTGTTFWRDAIEKEMANVMIAFEFDDDDKVPPGHKKIECHMIFDIKSSLQRKARFVAGGHMTEPPKESIFASVVTRDSVRLAFTIAALNGLDILAADVQNAYLNAPTKEKCYFHAGLEFGATNVGRPVKIVRALYGLRSSGARWRDHMASTLRDAGFKSCLADPDVWMRPAVKKDGTKYYEYVLCYVDDILAISENPQRIMDHLAMRYTLKDGTVKDPEEYLGAQVSRIDMPDGTQTWCMSSDLYVKRAIADVERELGYVGQTLRKKASTPFSTKYRPELDGSPELDPKRANYFQGLVGVLRWIIELGRVDIMTAVTMLSRYLVNPREGHLEEAFHVFAYLKQHNHASILFDASYPEFDQSRFTECDWSEFYPDAAEPVPPRAPELRGKPVHMTCFVDADHAGCHETRRSHTGIIIYVQKTPIVWYSKRQNTVESSTFGSEFVAMKTAIEQVEGLRYKLRMMGIPIDGATDVFCDNESVFKNATHPESTLKKKHNAIAYHRTREAIAAGIVRVAWEDGRFNLADVLTKLLPGPRLRELVSCILFRTWTV